MARQPRVNSFKDAFDLESHGHYKHSLLHIHITVMCPNFEGPTLRPVSRDLPQYREL